MDLEHIDGHKKGQVILFALSTCGWCKKTRSLLEELGIAYDYIYVDLTENDKRIEALEELKRWNPSLSFPTLIINNERVIIGFDRTSIVGALG